MGKPRQTQPVWLLKILYSDQEISHDAYRFVVCENPGVLNRQILVTIAEYVQGNWDEYDEDAVKELREAIEARNYELVVERWNRMSVLQLDTEETVVVQKVPIRKTNVRTTEEDVKFNWPEEPEFYVSTYCNFAHRMDDGEPVSKRHTECWIHPMILKTEREYDVDTVYRVEEAFAKELEDEEWDDWDAIVEYLKDNPE
jgi:hypothetical protein